MSYLSWWRCFDLMWANMLLHCYKKYMILENSCLAVYVELFWLSGSPHSAHISRNFCLFISDHMKRLVEGFISACISGNFHLVQAVRLVTYLNRCPDWFTTFYFNYNFTLLINRTWAWWVTEYQLFKNLSFEIFSQHFFKDSSQM